MKKYLLFIFLLLAASQAVTAQEEMTKEELFRLYHKAQRAEKNGNTEEALEIYKTLLVLDPAFPVPYLKMANIYAADESNGESVAAAIALYGKYLNLQPHDESTPVIKGKVAQLQKLGIDGQGANLADIIYIDQVQAQNVIAAKARIGARAATREELERQVEETDALYGLAQKAINDNDMEAGEKYAGQLTDQTNPANPLSIQTYMKLAEMYRKQGNVHKMQEVLATMEENMTAYRQMRQYYHTVLKDTRPFEDDICGIWISDLMDGNATPFFAVEIQRSNAYGKYQATLLPYCTLAEKYDMYTGNPFHYEARYNRNSQNYFAHSSVDSVHSGADKAFFHFGSRKFRGTSTEFDEFFIESGMDAVRDVTKETSVAMATNPYLSEADARMASAAIEVAGALFQGLLAWASVKKTTETSLELKMQRLFAGCADISLVHNTFVTKSTGYQRESSQSWDMRIYKLYPEDSILFAARGDELYGYKMLDRDETLKTEEYEYLQALKDKSYFNRQAYKKLSDRVSSFCFAKAEENPDFQILAAECRTRFEYSLKGLSFRTIRNKDGVLEGWVDVFGNMNGFGKGTFNDGTTYIGSWENHRYSGDGKITFRDKTTGKITQEYTGAFKDNNYHGKGLLQRGNISYEGDFLDGIFEGTGILTDANGDKYSGTWKKDKPVSGTVTYADGSRYEGECSYNKKTQQIERNGKGTIVYADGETASGKWKSNKLTAKK